MIKPCMHKGLDGVCDYPDVCAPVAVDGWTDKCLQVFNHNEIVCAYYYSAKQEDVKFGLDNQAKT